MVHESKHLFCGINVHLPSILVFIRVPSFWDFWGIPKHAAPKKGWDDHLSTKSVEIIHIYKTHTVQKQRPRPIIWWQVLEAPVPQNDIPASLWSIIACPNQYSGKQSWQRQSPDSGRVCSSKVNISIAMLVSREEWVDAHERQHQLDTIRKQYGTRKNAISLPHAMACHGKISFSRSRLPGST